MNNKFVYTINGTMHSYVEGTECDRSVTNIFIGVCESMEGAAKVVDSLVDATIEQIVAKLDADGEIVLEWKNPKIGNLKGFYGEIHIMEHILLS